MQAAYAAYSAIASQAATVVGAMDKVWAGGSGVEGEGGSQSGSADAQQQHARLAVALQSREDGDEAYVQVSGPLDSSDPGLHSEVAGSAPAVTEQLLLSQ